MPTKRKAFNEFTNPSTLGPVVDLKDILSGSVADIREVDVGTAKTVPNKHPTIHNLPYRLAIIGEAPGEAEEFRGIPFCPTPTPTNYKAGASGRLLNEKLSHANIIRDACFVGNICQRRPPGNDISLFKFDGCEISDGLAQLSVDLKEFRPNVCLLLGKTALRAALGSSDIGNWRGSVFTSNIEGPFLGRKCLATYHPAACLRQWEWTPLLFFDLRRALEEASSPYFTPPERTYNVPVDFNNLIRKLEWILTYKPSLSYDIEGYYHNLKCISFSWTKNEAIVVPFVKMNGSSYWDNEGDELLLWQYILNILAAPDIPKTLQNGLYDRWCLQYGYDVLTYGSTDDIMLKFAEAYCELKKSLAFQNSILTKEPYYKEERGSEDMSTFLTYACKDSATTYECNERLNKLLLPSQQQHYRFNHSLLTSLLYMELKGIRYDTGLARQKLLTTNRAIFELQHELNIATETSKGELSFDDVRRVICFKNDPTKPRKQFKDDYKQIKSIFDRGGSDISQEEKGYISTVCGWGMNIKSIAWKTYLYETLKLPKQFKETEEGEKRLTADYESLLKLKKWVERQ